MWANPGAVPLTIDTPVRITPAGGLGTKAAIAILTNSSPFVCQVQGSSGLIRFLPAWTADTFEVAETNPYVVVTPTTALPTSTPYDRSMYVSWVARGEALPASYPQSFTPNVLPTQPTGTGSLRFSATTLQAATGVYPMVAAPGVGRSLFLDSMFMNLFYGGAGTTANCALQDSLGNTLHQMIVPVNAVSPPSVRNFNGFQVGDNLGLQFAVQFPAGATTPLAQCGFTDSVGVTQV